MKRDSSNAEELLRLAKSNPLLKKQLAQIESLPDKEHAFEAVRIGRMRGLYFSETDWLHLNPIQPVKKAA